MRVDAFDFELPDHLIALEPARPRDQARLLVVRPGSAVELEDSCVAALPNLLEPGDTLVLNDTKVIPARLTGRRINRGERPSIEVLLNRRIAPARWLAFARPGKRLEAGDLIRFGEQGRVCLLGELDATVAAKGDRGEVELAFNLTGAVLDEAVEQLGEVPLPPYIVSRRPAVATDRQDYQTVYAAREGAVAAPTAGLHFTPAMLRALADAGIGTAFVTLHVGAGTFLPVTAEDTAAHRMLPEWGEIDPSTAERLNRVRDEGGRIIAIGTTVLRLLESAADADGRIEPFRGLTELFIAPGYHFRAADTLMTNFHLPRSTLFMLVAAFCGLDTMKRAYAHAIAAGYRFYSYGDASLLFRSS
jgi:S-adenosylmethionine:tRNA ribosyltransferase-isomerase